MENAKHLTEGKSKCPEIILKKCHVQATLKKWLPNGSQENKRCQDGEEI